MDGNNLVYLQTELLWILIWGGCPASWLCFLYSMLCECSIGERDSWCSIILSPDQYCHFSILPQFCQPITSVWTLGIYHAYNTQFWARGCKASFKSKDGQLDRWLFEEGSCIASNITQRDTHQEIHAFSRHYLTLYPTYNQNRWERHLDMENLILLFAQTAIKTLSALLFITISINPPMINR